MKVLLIIDMQQGLVTPMNPMFDTDGVIKRINVLAEQFRQRNDKVIFIQHDGTSEGCCIPGTEAWEILPTLKVQPGDLMISKTVNDSFYKTKLNEVLDNLDVEELVITGSSTDFCIDATVKSALIQDYAVTVISNAHTTEDQPDLTARQIINHYNRIWKMMIPVKCKIKVVDFDEYTAD